MSRIPTWASYFPELDSEREVRELFREVSGISLDALDNDDQGATLLSDSAHFIEQLTPPVDSSSESSAIEVVASFLCSRAISDISSVGRSSPRSIKRSAVNSIAQSLIDAVRQIVARSVADELSRRRDEGMLHGSNPEERYADFRRQCASHEFLKTLSDRFPALIPAIRRRTDGTVRHVSEVIERIALHSPDLHRTFGIPAHTPVATIEIGVGDTHQNGRTVTVIRFEDDHAVVYKPRPIGVDARFNELLCWIHDRTGVDLARCDFLDCDTYGFMQYLNPAGPKVDPQNYFDELGALTAILHSLDGGDVHFENVLCKDGRPVLIDLETLLQRPLPQSESPTQTAPPAALEALSRSVLRLGVLPTIVRSSDGSIFDPSATGFASAVRSPYRVHQLVDDGTDRMRVVFGYHESDVALTIPTISDADAPGIMAQHLRDGFERAYRAILAVRPAFRNHVETRFAGLVVRVLNSETAFYTQLLTMTCNPEVLACPPSAEVLAHRCALKHPDRPKSIAAAEVRDLVGGDIPYFTTCTDSRRLFSSSGEDLGTVFDISPLEGVLRQIDQLGPDDLALQLRLIAASYASKQPPERVLTGQRWQPGIPTHGTLLTRSDQIRATLGTVADMLVDSAYRSIDRSRPADWLCLNVSGDSDADGWSPGTVGIDLYGGRSGIAIGLAAAGAVADDERYTRLALDVIEPMIELLEPGTPFHGPAAAAGAHAGHGGCIRAVLEVARLADRPDLVDEAYRLLGDSHDFIESAAIFDVVGGLNGLVATAVRMHADATTPHHRDLCAQLIVAGAQRVVAKTPDILAGFGHPKEVQSGYAHGAAGFYPWLVAAAGLGAGDKALEAARSFLKCERSMFSEATGDWRRTAGGIERSVGWCHGAPGILIAKVLTESFAPEFDDGLAAEAQVAKDATIRDGFGNNVTYCHGDLGNLQILGEYARHTADDDLRASVDATFASLNARYLSSFAMRSDCRYALTNSLLLGLSGVVHASAHALDPLQVRPVLW